MSYKVSFENLGRTKKSYSFISEKEPDYEVLRKGTGDNLMSGEIDFNVSSEGNGVICGGVYVGGFRHVGDFTIEKLETNG
jgi:hypothetical protein